MKKWFFRILIGVPLLLAAVVVLAIYLIDGIARSAVEAGGTYALGVPTTLQSLKIGLVSQKVSLADLEVDNPEGFDTPHFLQLHNGHVEVSLGSLMQDTIVVPELALTGISMNLEKKQGTSNYQVILDNLKKSESQEEPSPDTPAEPTEGKKFVIQKLSILNVQVQVDLLPIGGELTRVPVTIDQIELTDLGSDSDKGVLLADLSGIVVKAILSAVVNKASQILPGDIAGELAGGLSRLKGLGEVSVKIASDITKGVGQVGQEVGGKIIEGGKQVTQELEKTGENIEKGLENAGKSITEGLGGLLDKEKKKEESQ